MGAASRHCSPNLGKSQYVRPFSQSASRARVTTWVSTHAPILWVIRLRGSLPSSRTMHANRLLGRDPLMGRLCPGGFPTVVRTCRVSTLYARVPCEWGFSFLVLEVWLENHLSSPSITVWGPRPDASTSLPCRLLLCRLLHGRSYPWVSWGDTLLAQAHS